MTDIATREEVTTTIPDVITALTLPHVGNMAQKVKRFGFEFEFFPSGWDDGGDGYYSDDDDYDEDEPDESCTCRICIDARAFAEARRNNPQQYNRSGGGVGDLVERAYANGLIRTNDIHHYHCHCHSCSPRRTDALMCAQEDGSCGVEFVSRIIDLDDFERSGPQIASWVEMFNGWKDDGHWMPDGITSNGNHIHISSGGDDGHEWPAEIRAHAYQHIDAMYAAFNWNNIADGGCGRIRGYNAKPQTNGRGGSWLSDRGYGTFEHRLWNTPAIPERLWAHLGISIGITRWAFAIASQLPTFSFWENSGRDRYGYVVRNSTMSDQKYKLLTDNIGEVVRGIRSYVPEHDHFTPARDLILNLTSG